MKKKILFFSFADKKVETLVKSLCEHDYDVCIFRYTEFSPQLLDSEQPSLIILNLKPKSADDAFRAISEIKRQNPRLGILALSTHDNSALAKQAYSVGATSYFFTPLKIENLLAILKITEDKVNQEYEYNKIKQDSISLINQFNNVLVATRTLGENAAFTKENIKNYASTVLRKFAESFDARDGSIYLIEDAELVLLSQLDESHVRPKAISLPFESTDTSAFNYVFTKNELIVIEAINNKKEIKKSGWSGYKDESFLAFPLGNAKKRVAIIALNDSNREPFSVKDKDSGIYNHLMSYATIRISNEIISLSSENLKTPKKN